MSRWLVDAVVVISGFVVPRLLDTHLGQEQLGIWDFGWTIVSYCRFLGFGMAGGLNRFVALNTAKGDRDALRRAVSSTIALQVLVALVTIAVTIGVASIINSVLPDLDAELHHSAKWCVILLGATVATRMLAWPARGILTGQHRWAVNSYVTVAGDIAAFIAMILVMWLAPSLVLLAGSYLAIAAVTESMRYVVARKAYPEKLFDRRSVCADSLKSLFVFGLKTNLGGLGNLIVVQTVSLALAVSGGPALLAVFARALALQRHAQVAVRSFAEVLTSIAASMQGLGMKEQTRQLFLESSRISLAMTMPLFMVLAFVGNQLLVLWMGPAYVTPGTLTVLCIGTMFPASQSAAFRILAGMNWHGRIALNAFISTMVLLAICGTVASISGWTPLVAAIVAGVCLSFGFGAVVVIGSCRAFKVGVREYLEDVVRLPLVINSALAVFFVAGHTLDMRDSLLAVLMWAIAGGVLTAGAYWRWLIPPGMKTNIKSRIQEYFLSSRLFGSNSRKRGDH